jgi:rhodanese-related sulfurtransferase
MLGHVTSLAARVRLLAAPPGTLGAAEALVAAAWPDVAHLSPDMAASAGMRLIDVRGADEIMVSRVPGTATLLPEDAAAAARSGALGDRPLLLYCAIGVRSSVVAARLAPVLPPGQRVASLSGGIFRWRSEGRPLVTADGAATRDVHPFSARWAHLAAV